MEAMEDEELTSEMDMKFDPLKQDDCCLLCGQLAIAYDLEGNVVKRERDEDVNEGQQQHFTCQDLFSFLCRCFKVKKDDWSFHSNSKDLFPFCEMCEFLLVSLAEIYCRLDELEEVLKAKMVEAEEDKFWKERLYMKHNDRYFTFRKQVLKEKFKGNRDYRSESKSTLQNKGPPSSPVVVAKSNEVVCEVPSSSAVELRDTDTRLLRSRSCKMPRKEVPSQLPSSSEEKDKSDMDCSSDEDEQVVDMDDLKCNESESSASSTDTMSDDQTDMDKAKKRIKKTTNKRKSKVDKACSDPLRNRPRGKNVKRHAPARNPRKPKNSTWRADNAGFMIKDPETGNITYTTGYGNRFRSTRTVLQFTKLGKKGGYQCCTCLDIIPFASLRRKRQSRFRDHFIRIHSPRYTCRLCENPSRCSSQEELLQHVISTHDMLDLQSYHKALAKMRLLQSMDKRAELKRKRESLYSDSKSNCNVCDMPFTNLEDDKIREHNMSHMNETEQQELERMVENLSLIKTYQCHSCGKSVKGLLALRSHEGTHAKSKTCPICGFSYKGLDIHIAKVHGYGTWNFDKYNLGTPKCRVCGMPLSNLQKVAIKEHEKSHMSPEERLRKEKKCYSRTISNSLNTKRKAVSTCNVCEMPLPGKRSAIEAHQWSHLSQEERQEKERELLNPAKEPGKIVLREHEKTQEDSRCVCPICGESYKLEKTLNRHIEKVHPNGTWKGPFSCNYPSCEESLDSDSSLLVHVEKEHTNSEEARKRIMCLKCGKVLASPWAVKTHGLVHTKERNFKCDICLKTYSLKDTLENHLAAMHGVGGRCATFRCEQQGCGAVYRSNVYLKGHLRRIHGIYMRKAKN